MDLEKFKQLLNEQKNGFINTNSFLESINLQFDENIISRYFLYILKNNIELLDLIVRNCYKHCFVDISSVDYADTEYVTDENKRIDILISGKDINNDNFVIVIENKVYSTEHDDQCSKYYDYCEKAFSNYKKYYLFLYPDFNTSIKDISNSNFKKITYSEIGDIILSLDNRSKYESDFVDLIINQLRSKTMDDLKIFLINNYSQIKENMDSINKEIDNIFNEIKYNFLKNNDNFFPELVDNHRTLRLYKDDIKWWNGWDVSNEERIFFYVEVKCEEHLDFYLQRTLKVYSKNLNTKANRYALSMNEKLVKHKYMNTYKVFERIKILSNYQPLSNEWKNDLFAQIEGGLKQLIIHQQEEVQSFDNFN